MSTKYGAVDVNGEVYSYKISVETAADDPPVEIDEILAAFDALDAENINLRRKVKDLERQMMTAAKNYAKKKGSNS